MTTDFRALCAELVDELNYHADEHSVDKLIARARTALATPPPEPFVVRHYASDDYPSIKGNGFDGLRVGEDREEAEEFIDWVNKHCVLATPPPEPPTDEELWATGDDFFQANYYPTDAIKFARAVLKRWGK